MIGDNRSRPRRGRAEGRSRCAAALAGPPNRPHRAGALSSGGDNGLLLEVEPARVHGLPALKAGQHPSSWKNVLCCAASGAMSCSVGVVQECTGHEHSGRIGSLRGPNQRSLPPSHRLKDEKEVRETRARRHLRTCAVKHHCLESLADSGTPRHWVPKRGLAKQAWPVARNPRSTPRSPYCRLLAGIHSRLRWRVELRADHLG